MTKWCKACKRETEHEAVVSAMTCVPCQRHTIQVQPDKPAILAQRLTDRLVRDRLLDELGPERQAQRSWQTKVDQITEALADEIHQDIIDGTLRR